MTVLTIFQADDAGGPALSEASNGPVRAAENQRAEDSKIDKYLDSRFGGKKEVVSEK